MDAYLALDLLELLPLQLRTRRKRNQAEACLVHKPQPLHGRLIEQLEHIRARRHACSGAEVHQRVRLHVCCAGSLAAVVLAATRVALARRTCEEVARDLGQLEAARRCATE